MSQALDPIQQPAVGVRVVRQSSIADAVFVASITTNQTTALLKRFATDFATRTEAQKVLNRVILMTPENIHLNSFMYEPILDMSDDHLRRLYTDVLQLV